MRGNVELFQAERDVNCVLCFLNSITQAKPCPSKCFLTILNYILLKTTKKFLQLFEKQLSQFKSSASLKNSMSTRTDLFNLRKNQERRRNTVLATEFDLLFIMTSSEINFKIP